MIFYGVSALIAKPIGKSTHANGTKSPGHVIPTRRDLAVRRRYHGHRFSPKPGKKLLVNLFRVVAYVNRLLIKTQVMDHREMGLGAWTSSEVYEIVRDDPCYWLAELPGPRPMRLFGEGLDHRKGMRNGKQKAV